jgi:hypothetical protein
MKPISLFLALCSLHLFFTPVAGEAVSDPIVRHAEAFVRERVGAIVYQEYVTFVGAKMVQPSPTCLAPDSKCDPAFREPHYHLEFSLRIPHRSFVNERLSFFLDGDGVLIEEAGVHGIPRCATEPAECDFDRVDAVVAETMARKHGLVAGVDYWKLDFLWNARFSTYVWTITATTEDSDSYAEGTTLMIDANSGEVLDTYVWYQHSCGP